MWGGQLTRTWTSFAPASLRLFTRALQVVPRTIESSTTTTRLPFTSAPMRFKRVVVVDDSIVRRLEKAASDVVIAHERHLVRNARLHRITERGGVAAVGHGNHHVRR